MTPNPTGLHDRQYWWLRWNDTGKIEVVCVQRVRDNLLILTFGNGDYVDASEVDVEWMGEAECPIRKCEKCGATCGAHQTWCGLSYTEQPDRVGAG